MYFLLIKRAFFVIFATLAVASCASQSLCTLDKFKRCTSFCDEGDASACFILGLGFHIESPRDDNKSVEAYIRGCKLGSLESCGNLGLMHENGWGTEKNLSLAMELYWQVCAAGIPVHCRNVGRLYEGDAGFTADIRRSNEVYESALKLALTQCESNNASSCAVAGHMYKDGKGVDKNQSLASQLFRRACSLGYSWACEFR
jgi:TPR repeat protein